MISKFLSHKNKIFILFLFFFSIIINQHYGNRGVFPMDSFFHFDAGYRILNGEHPFKDFWVVSGPTVDYIQAVFFYIFGTNWQSYVLHASLFNALLTISTFFILQNFKLKNIYCFIYSSFFAILAYPSSGTPFADHHSAFFSLLGIYSLLLAINNQRKMYWILLPILLGFSFLSKSIPSSFVIISVCFIVVLYSLKKKNFDPIKYCLIGLSFFVLCVLVFGKYHGIKLSTFLDQYIFYPQTIGAERFKNLSFTFSNVINHFKFIYLAIVPIFYVNIKKIFSDKNYLKHNDFYFFLSLFLLTFSLILYQLLTKNQTIIFFLIPILIAFSHINLSSIKLKSKNLIFLTFILICLLVTFKYHLRFNEDRKFHELQNTNLELSIDAKKIHKKLSGLNWITPQFKDNPKKEINLINQIQSSLISDSRNKMVLTNYPFFSAILNDKLFSPFRVYAGDGTQQPLKGNKYTVKYEELMINLIKKNKISVIYIIGDLESNIIYDYIDKYCFEEATVFKQLKSYELKNCIEIDG